jgi:translation initiation factor IF-2
VNQAIDFDTASMVAEEFGWRIESTAFDISDYVEAVPVNEEDLEPRPPVITVMGHVDHGKTSLLDYIRNTRVTDGEAGGITQHIGAYRVNLPGRGTVIFIDTPGHEAFTAMRARGAKATDMVILVVAADDGVMPQTIEAINHAKAANVPIVVACNKIDKANANVDKVLSDLSEHGLVAEEWGGDTVLCKVSALKGDGIDHLLEMLLLQAEILELKGNPKAPARGLILEGRLEKGRGPVATVLVQEGTLQVGDTIVSKTVSGRIRALHDDMGNKVQSAGPSMPVEVLGLSGVPEASEEFLRVKDDKAAAKIVGHRVAQQRLAAQAKNRPTVSLDNLHEMLEAGAVHELKIIVKSDVHGSGEALAESLEKLSHPEVKVNVIHNAVGGITESDVNLASASDAIIVGFGVRPAGKAKSLAEALKVDVKLYTIIYEALADVRDAMAGMLAPIEQEKALGMAEVREVFGIPKLGNIAGCTITEGVIHRNARIRVVRDSVQVYEGAIGSLRRFKENVKEVKQGYECGIGITNFNDIKVGDMLEAYEIEEIAATLD